MGYKYRGKLTLDKDPEVLEDKATRRADDDDDGFINITEVIIPATAVNTDYDIKIIRQSRVKGHPKW